MLLYAAARNLSIQFFIDPLLFLHVCVCVCVSVYSIVTHTHTHALEVWEVGGGWGEFISFRIHFLYLFPSNFIARFIVQIAIGAKLFLPLKSTS